MTTTFPPPLPPTEFEDAYGRRLLTRQQFAEAVGRAVESRTGYTAGKLGVTERALLQYPMLIAGGAGRVQLLAFEQALNVKALRHSGVFPAESTFYREYTEFYADRVRELDCIGLATEALRHSLEIMRFYSLDPEVMRYHDQEPDRSAPPDDASCYLPRFAGRRVLLVCPFAEALRARANKETFEAVWAKTGKGWFEPAAVEALEFPYGFARETQERYPTCLDLLADINAGIDAIDFDVALIAAGGIAIPIASHVKSLGKVGISLGGALQPTFGVIGERWRAREIWRERYINDAWIDVPAKYRPKPGETDENYW
jgi:hypothetical protein